MSADNGTYILQTYGPEFRVAHAQAIDNIYGAWDGENNTWVGDPEFILDVFGESKVFHNLDEAWDAANAIDQTYEISEYGVCLISDWQSEKFSDLIEVDKNGTSISS